MNVERSPVVNDVVVLWRHGDDAHLRMLAEQIITDAWPPAWLVQRDDHEVWQRPLHVLGDLGIVGDLTDNFDVWLICESCEDGFAQQTRTVRHEDPDSFFHGTLPAWQVSGSQTIGVRFKKRLSERLVWNWVQYQLNI